MTTKPARTVSVKTEISTANWAVDISEDGTTTILRDGRQVLTMPGHESFWLGAAMVEAASKAYSTKMTVKVGPKGRTGWSALTYEVPTDKNGVNLLGRKPSGE